MSDNEQSNFRNIDKELNFCILQLPVQSDHLTYDMVVYIKQEISCKHCVYTEDQRKLHSQKLNTELHYPVLSLILSELEGDTAANLPVSQVLVVWFLKHDDMSSLMSLIHIINSCGKL